MFQGKGILFVLVLVLSACGNHKDEVLLTESSTSSHNEEGLNLSSSASLPVSLLAKGEKSGNKIVGNTKVLDGGKVTMKSIDKYGVISKAGTSEFEVCKFFLFSYWGLYPDSFGATAGTKGWIVFYDSARGSNGGYFSAFGWKNGKEIKALGPKLRKTNAKDHHLKKYGIRVDSWELEKTGPCADADPFALGRLNQTEEFFKIK